jgi:hypothetical protein
VLLSTFEAFLDILMLLLSTDPMSAFKQVTQHIDGPYTGACLTGHSYPSRFRVDDAEQASCLTIYRNEDNMLPALPQTVRPVAQSLNRQT